MTREGGKRVDTAARFVSGWFRLRGLLDQVYFSSESECLSLSVFITVLIPAIK